MRCSKAPACHVYFLKLCRPGIKVRNFTSAGKAAVEQLTAQNVFSSMSNTLFVGKVYHRFDELPSTNDYARELIAKSKPSEGMVVRAASQSAGRGQFGSKWVAEPGANLTLSVILYPTNVPVQAQFRLSEAIALAVWDTVDKVLSAGGEHLPGISIKWPNDIYIGSRKAAGILIQNTLNGQYLQSSVAGIGLNVNQTDFPPEAPNATSLCLMAGQPFDLEAVAGILFEQIERRYLQLKAGRFAALRDEYCAHLLGLGEVKQFGRPDGSRFTGIIRGVAENGRLVILIDGVEALFDIKEVQLV